MTFGVRAAVSGPWTNRVRCPAFVSAHWAETLREVASSRTEKIEFKHKTQCRLSKDETYQAEANQRQSEANNPDREPPEVNIHMRQQRTGCCWGTTKEMGAQTLAGEGKYVKQ